MKIKIYREGNKVAITIDGETRVFIGEVIQEFVGDITMIEINEDDNEHN